MKLSELRDVILTLDRAYEDIAAEAAKNEGAPNKAQAADPSSWFYHRGPRAAGTGAQAGVGCDDHGGAAHGLESDRLSSTITQEMTPWLWLAGGSEIARQALSVGGTSGAEGARVPGDARFGTMVSYEDGTAPANGDGFDVRFAASHGVVEQSEGGRLWAPRGSVDRTLRRGADGPRVVSVPEPSGSSRKIAFDSVAKGYEQYLRAEGQRVDPEAVSRLGDCPPARLLSDCWHPASEEQLGAASGGPRRIPMGYGESWLDAGRVRERDSLWSEPCHACRFGLGTWACGYQELRGRVDPRTRAAYDREALDWDRFLKNEGSEARRANEEKVASYPTAAAQSKSAVSAAAELAGLGASGAAKGKAVTPEGGATAAIGKSVTDVARGRESIAVTGRRLDPSMFDVVPGGGPAGPRGHVHIRLQSEEFDCSEIEVRALDGKERISELFSFEVLIVCPISTELTVEQVGASVSIVFDREGASIRQVHGMIAQLDDRLETEPKWRSYRLAIVPRLWRASLVTTQEVHVNISVPDLIRQKLTLVGLEEGKDFELRLRGTYAVRELVVQYKETDVAFIARLAEHLGICFFFEHEDGVDKLVFSDDNAGFATLSRAEIAFRPEGQRVDVFELESRARAFSARFAMQDYNYRTPTVDLTSTHDESLGFGGGVVEYGAHYKSPADGAALARVRAEEQVVENRYLVGASDVGELDTGRRFQLVGHPKLDDLALLVVGVEHHVVQTVQMNAGATEPYRNRFRVVDASLTYRPPRATPRPRICGVLTALVEPDPSRTIAELAQIDEAGRYTVQFYFDAGDVLGRPKHSHPVRMIQAHSGPHYGIHFPLKPGIEVLIVFMDGDPDRPLIVGSVPNPMTPSPVVDQVNLMNRIETASGLIIEMRDAVPPHVK